MRSGPLLAVAALALVAGATRVAGVDDTRGEALLAAGLVLLGAWIATEIMLLVRDKEDDDGQP